jgi:hypothetical protein
MKRTVFVSLLLIALVGQSLAQTAIKITSAERKVAEGVTAKQLSQYLHFVASDDMQGRNTPSQGLNIVARFIALNLERWGFKPAGDNGTYFQDIALSTWKIDPANTTVTVGGQPLAWGTDFLANPAMGSVANAPLVFGGSGWYVKSKGWEPLKGVDAKGKVVVFYAENFPKGMTIQQVRALGAAGVDYMDPVAYAKANGAVGIILLNTPAVNTTWDRTRRTRETGGNFSVDKFRTGTVENFPVITLSQKGSDALLAGSGADLDAIAKGYQADSIPAVNLSKSVAINVNAVQVTSKTQNVVAIWEGSDPKLKDEMVAIGAHYDHVGNSPDTGCRQLPNDTICNGADDDGSGTVSVLSIAEALAKTPQRPKRSVLFVWHCGEEKGLWGSQYLNAYPPAAVNIKNVIAQLNIDMIGRSKKAGDTEPRDKDLTGENAIYVIGKDMMSSVLSNVVGGVNAGYLKLDYDTRYDDPKDPNRFFYRSDHFNYAKNGIPITFWFDGVHVDYHQPGDEPDKIDYDKMEKVARTIIITLWELTDLKERPKVDKELPEQLKAAQTAR